jgi:beta-lactamase class A
VSAATRVELSTDTHSMCVFGSSFCPQIALASSRARSASKPSCPLEVRLIIGGSPSFTPTRILSFVWSAYWNVESSRRGRVDAVGDAVSEGEGLGLVVVKRSHDMRSVEAMRMATRRSDRVVNARRGPRPDTHRSLGGSLAFVQDHIGPARALIERAPFRVGAFARSADGETLLEHDADRAFPSASVIKVPLVMTLYADATEGRIDLERRLRVEERVDGSGVLRDMRDVTDVSLRDLAALTMILSDNTATNLVIDAVGVERVAARLGEWGCRTTALRRRMYDFESAKRGLENVATARELASLLAVLVEGRCVDRATSDAVLAVMERCADDTMLRRFLAPGTKVPSKSGTLDASRNDVAVLRGPERTVLVAAFTSHVDDHLAAEHLLGIMGRCAAVAAGLTVPPLPFGD